MPFEQMMLEQLDIYKQWQEKEKRTKKERGRGKGEMKKRKGSLPKPHLIQKLTQNVTSSRCIRN